MSIVCTYAFLYGVV